MGLQAWRRKHKSACRAPAVDAGKRPRPTAMAVEGFVFGVQGLDSVLPGALRPGYVVVVAGHPGSGKTILASTICYKNALRLSAPCLYISLQEDREKLFAFLKGVGVDFEALEGKGLLTLIKFPLATEATALVDEVSRAVASTKPRVVVVDSVNALLQGIKEEDRRLWLQNYFYELAKVIEGLVILVAEVPLGEERVVGLGSVEFVADAILMLKHRIERGLLTRVVEVRKARGAPLTVAELPFSIGAEGIRVYAPPILSGIAPIYEELEPPCKVLKGALDHLHKGHVIYVELPPDYRVPESVALIAGLAIINDLKGLVISYLYPPETMKDLLVKTLTAYGVSASAMYKAIEKHFTFRGLNPFAFSALELVAEELQLVEKVSPDIVVFHGVCLLAFVEPKERFYQTLYNEINTLRRQGRMIVRIGGRINDEISSAFSVLADVVLKFVKVEEGLGEQSYRLYVWRRGQRAYVITREEVEACLREIAEAINARCGSPSPQ